MSQGQDIHQPHDKLFKETFSNPQNAGAFLNPQLPHELAAALDWSSAKLLPGSFIDSQFRQSESDLLFSLRVSGTAAMVYILFEHQKSEDRAIALRLLRYMVRIWEQCGRTQPGASSLPVIIPVVVAQNDRPWDIPEFFGQLLDVPEGAAVFVPDFTFRLVQLAEIAFGQIAGTPDGILVMRTLKADAEKRLLAGEVWDESLLGISSTRTLEMVLRYILSRDVDKEAFRGRLSLIEEPRLRQNAMTLAQQFIEEGRQEGRKEGILAGQIRALQEILAVPLTPEDVLLETAEQDLKQLLAELKSRLGRK